MHHVTADFLNSLSILQHPSKEAKKKPGEEEAKVKALE